MKIQRISEQFSDTGGMPPQAVLTQIKDSSYSPGAMLLRELLQNSWDARDGDSIDFHCELRLLEAPELKAVHSFLLAEAEQGPPGPDLELGGSPLAELVSDSSPKCLL